jgi:hypothetical protein
MEFKYAIINFKTQNLNAFKIKTLHQITILTASSWIYLLTIFFGVRESPISGSHKKKFKTSWPTMQFIILKHKTLIYSNHKPFIVSIIFQKR